MKTNLLNLITLLFTLTLFAQRPAQSYGSIQKKIVEGKVLDRETNQVLEYATITFTNKRNSNLLQGGITDSNGQATLTIVPNENYNKTTTVTVEVTDGDLTDSETFELTIDPRNDNPEISIEDQETDEEVDFVIASLIDYSTDIDSDLNLNQSPYDLSQLRFEVQLTGDNFDKEKSISKRT